MSFFSELFGGGGGTKSIQSGFVSTTSLANGGGGEDNSYTDVTISSVDPSKCVVLFEGGAAGTSANAILKSGGTASYIVTPHLTSSTNLRLGTAIASQTHLVGRWQVLEFK